MVSYIFLISILTSTVELLNFCLYFHKINFPQISPFYALIT